MIIKKNAYMLAVVIFCSAIFLTNCSSQRFINETTEKLSSVETVFEVLLPAPIKEGEEIYLEIIDDVTGIGLNPTRYRMQAKDEKSFYTRIPITTGSVIKYRYVFRSNIDQIEKNTTSSSVLFRLYLTTRPSIVSDIVQSWSDEKVNNDLKGQISGFVFDQKTDLPIPDVILGIGGNMTVTGANGYYEFKDLPAGSYLITAIHPDGLYEPFQQGAVIAENALTPASFGMKSADLVNIEFIVTVPENTAKNAHVRLLGNTFQTGNMFTELDGSASVIPSRAPDMTYDGDRTYRIELQLPSGFDFRYKFSLGNGFINAERNERGEFLTRQLIVPKRNTKIKNHIFSWTNDPLENPVQFSVTTPENTPSEDILSIQFNPFAWTPPVPMWNTSQNEWTYFLYGPFEYLEQSQFRFCRNDQCGYADDVITAGDSASGYVLDLEELDDSRSIFYSISAWVGQEQSPNPAFTEQYRYNKPGFVSGMVLDGYNPYWLPYLEWGMIDAAISGADYLILSPSWPPQNFSSNLINQLPGDTFSSSEIQSYYNYAQQAGMNLTLYPALASINSSEAFLWDEIDTSYNGWSDWFVAYTQMVKNYAYLSEQLGLQLIIIGGPSVAPAFPNGRLPNGNPSNTPYDFSERWSDLITDVRGIFNGQIIFSLPEATLKASEAYRFLGDVDAIMIEVDSALTTNADADLQKISSGAAKLLDESLSEPYQTFNKPIIIGLEYSAIDGSASNCVGYTKNCKDLLSEVRGIADSLPVDLTEQAMIYQAIYSQALSRDWISGIFSLGYNPSVIVRDAGPSVRGKPALDVMAYYNNQIILD
jgi:hypothetical protein